MHRRPRKLPDEDLPNRIREWRIARGLSQEALAAQMQSSKQTVHRHETTEDVSLATLNRYARILEVRVEELLAASMRVPKSLARLVETAEKLSEDEQKQLEQFGSVMVRSHGPQMSGFAEPAKKYSDTN